MNFYLVKPTIINSEGKTLKRNYAVKSESSVMAEATVMLELSGADIKEITDINKKNWIDIISNELGGNWYEVKGQYLNEDDKWIKESYLVQEFSTKSAEGVITDLRNNLEITGVNLTNIMDYFKQEIN